MHSLFPLLLILFSLLALLPWLYRVGNRRKAHLTLVHSRDF